MIRVRFFANLEDYRPVNFPLPHPYWCTGETRSHSVMVSYADDEAYILKHWPEAKSLESWPAIEYIFTDRFPKPEWFNE